MDGWEVFRHPRAGEDVKDTPAIAVNAKFLAIDKALGLYIAKVDDYLVKPLRPGQLVRSTAESKDDLNASD